MQKYLSLPPRIKIESKNISSIASHSDGPTVDTGMLNWDVARDFIFARGYGD